MDYTNPGIVDDDQEELKGHKTEALLTLRRSTMAYVTLVLICWVTLGRPLEDIMLGGREITLPFAQVPVSYGGFLVFGPLLLFAVWFYIQVFMARLARPDLAAAPSSISVLGDMGGRLPIALSIFLHGLLLPATVALFAFKGRIYPAATYLWLALLVVLLAVLFGRFHASRPPLKRWLDGVHRGLFLAGVVAVSLLATCGWWGVRSGLFFSGGQFQISLVADVTDDEWSDPFFSGLLIDFSFAEVSVEDSTKRLNWSGLDLRYANFYQAKMPGIPLRGADLRGARMPRAIFEEADLSKANLKGAKLWRTNLEGADLRKANLEGASLFEADLKRADLREAKLHGANLREAKLNGAKLFRNDLEGVNLFKTDLEGATLKLVILEGANLSQANLEGATLELVKLEGANLSQANLEGLDLSGANLKEADLRGANLKGADLSKADLEGADLRKAVLAGADLQMAMLKGARMTEVNLKGADLSGANLEEAKLWLAKLEGANLSEANLDGAVLVGGNLENAKLVGGNLEKAKLAGANFGGVDLSALIYLEQGQIDAACYGKLTGPPKLPWRPGERLRDANMKLCSN